MKIVGLTGLSSPSSLLPSPSKFSLLFSSFLPFFSFFFFSGGIACGKSTVSKLLREHDLPVIDADVIARQVVEPGLFFYFLFYFILFFFFFFLFLFLFFVSFSSLLDYS